jgi:Domain of unknown function (DUF6473)
MNVSCQSDAKGDFTLDRRTAFTHDYSPRDHELLEYGVYELPALPGMILRGPAVDIENRSDYFSCIGAAQTLGVYVANPFPDLLTQRTGLTGWNLGVGGASPGFFLKHPELFPYINNGRFAILQVMTARDEPNDRMQSTAVASAVVDRKHGDTVPAQVLWQRIMNEEPQNLERYIAQSRASWETHMAELVAKITVPIVHFWFSPKPLDARLDPTATSVAGIIDEFPQFINGDNLGYASRAAIPLVCCFSKRDMKFSLRSRYTGKSVQVDYAVLDRTGATPSFFESENIYYPSPQMHWDAAIMLGNVIERHKLA